ncbi:MAG: UDP-2,3-diacylglucosamine diphosphatase [Betaproteobacteria bacterium]
MPFTAFISDLHLTPSRPTITRIFLDFLRRDAREADALYILGDLFEYWAGDDDLSDPLNAQVAGALNELAHSGTPVYLMHGNRDFLLLDRFVHAASAQLISDPTTVDLYGNPTLLMHGDTLCTDDARYQAFRARVRSPLWQRVFLLQPLWLRRAEIERARRMSERAKHEKPAAIMDVTAAAVQQAFKACACSRMIHGHTHRPARHVHQVDGRICERWVLADWYEQGQYLRVTPERCESITLN